MRFFLFSTWEKQVSSVRALPLAPHGQVETF